MQMVAQITMTPADQPGDDRTSEYATKYGPPGSFTTGWDPLEMPTVATQPWTRHAITGVTAFVTSAFYYLTLAHLPIAGTSLLLPPDPWFPTVLLGLPVLAVLGVVIVNWLSRWKTPETLNRIATALVIALLVLAIGETGWLNLIGNSTLPPLHLLCMLVLAALGVTVGSLHRVSANTYKGVGWLLNRMRPLAMGVVLFLTTALGYTLTSSQGIGPFSPFGLLLGAGIGAVFLWRVDRKLKQKPHP
jgi:hypothetical protein